MTIHQSTQIPEVRDTIVMLRQISADEQVKMEAYYREKRLHDEASALGSARREGKEEGIVEGIEIGRLNMPLGLVEDGILTMADAARRATLTVSEFEQKTGLKA